MPHEQTMSIFLTLGMLSIPAYVWPEITVARSHTSSSDKDLSLCDYNDHLLMASQFYSLSWAPRVSHAHPVVSVLKKGTWEVHFLLGSIQSFAHPRVEFLANTLLL